MTYEIMGFAMPEGGDVNTNPSAGTATQPPLVPIYTTDDLAEVNHILEAGGFIDSNNVYWIAEGYRELDTGGNAPIAKSAVTPFVENSTAEVMPDGSVRTDRTKNPETQEDVIKAVERELDLPPKKRTILPSAVPPSSWSPVFVADFFAEPPSGTADFAGIRLPVAGGEQPVTGKGFLLATVARAKPGAVLRSTVRMRHDDHTGSGAVYLYGGVLGSVGNLYVAWGVDATSMWVDPWYRDAGDWVQVTSVVGSDAFVRPIADHSWPVESVATLEVAADLLSMRGEFTITGGAPGATLTWRVDLPEAVTVAIRDGLPPNDNQVAAIEPWNPGAVLGWTADRWR